MMTVVAVLEKDVLRMICGDAPQSAVMEEKQSFYDEMKGEWDMDSASDLVMCLGDIDGHIGRHIDRYDGDHGWYGTGQRNLEGRRLLEFCPEKELGVSNTSFKR